jgi:hypothetical protein
MTIYTGAGELPEDPQPGFYGQVYVTGSLAGALEFRNGPVRPGGTPDAVFVGGSLTGRVVADSWVSRNLVIAGNVNSTTAEAPISIGGNVTAQIRVYGSLLDDPNAPYEIDIAGAMPSAISIDWDGDQQADTWEPGAVIRIGTTEYYENDWQARVYEIGSCRGDMQGDWAVGFPDINPFVAALSDPAAYAQMLPGLEGSMIYHGDANCDEVFDFADINPFVARVTTGNCDCGYSEDRRGGDGTDSMPPEDLAALLAENVAPELYDDLLAVVAAAIDAAPDDETQAYWQEVYAALTQ